jgi:hypothetical protein
MTLMDGVLTFSDGWSDATFAAGNSSLRSRKNESTYVAGRRKIQHQLRHQRVITGRSANVTRHTIVSAVGNLHLCLRFTSANRQMREDANAIMTSITKTQPITFDEIRT